MTMGTALAMYAPATTTIMMELGMTGITAPLYRTGQGDRDDDDVGNACDNCPNNFNPDQQMDGDGAGDARHFIPDAWIICDGKVQVM